MSDPLPPTPYSLSLAERYAGTLLNVAIACVVLVGLCVLAEGLWLYFHPSFY